MWTVSSGTLTGPHHRRRGEDNQDAVAVWADDEQGFALTVVADGAGSLPRSGEGARLAVKEAVSVVRGLCQLDFVEHEPLVGWVLEDSVRQAIAAAARVLNAD